MKRVLPNILTRLPDELLFSYLQRLAKSNGLSQTEFERAYAIPPTSSLHFGYRPRRDSAYDYSQIYRITQQTESLLQFYLGSTLLTGCVPLLTKPVIASYAAQWAYRNELAIVIPQRNSLINRIRICPQCAREDIEAMGFFYSRRSHQMLDAAVCYRHGCPLKEYTDSRTYHELENLAQYHALCISSESPQYELFLHDLLYSDIQSPLEDVLPALKAADAKEHQKYNNSFPNRISPQRLAHSLFQVFGSSESLKEALQGGDDRMKEKAVDAISGFGRLSQPYREDFVEIQCLSCGLTFVTTPYRVLQGFQCPDCDRKLSSDELIRRVASRAYEGSYILTDYWPERGNTMSLIHRSCGQIQMTTIQRFIVGEYKCKTCKQLSEENVKSALKEKGNGEFELVNGNDLTRLVILHKRCGQTFTRRFEIAIQYPVCPQCNLNKQRAPRIPEFLWDTMMRRNTQKRNGVRKCREYLKRENLRKVEEPELGRTTSLGLKSAN